MIDEHGLSVLPISSLGLDYAVSTERISTGIERLDAMLGGKGYYRGSSVLVSGTAGTGKTQHGRRLCRCRLPPGRTLPLLGLRGGAGADHAQHALDRLRPGAMGPARVCCASTPCAPRSTAWSSTW